MSCSSAPSVVLRLGSCELEASSWTHYASLSACTLTETEQTLRVEVRDLLLVIHVDGHLIKELSGSFHVTVWIVCGEEDAVDTDRVHHAQIRLIRQTPTLIDCARLLAYVLTRKNSTVEILPKVFLDGSFQSTVLTQWE